MKKSIYFAFLILFLTIGWLASGQLINVSANDDDNQPVNSTSVETKISNLNDSEDLSKNIIKVEIKNFKAQQIFIK